MTITSAASADGGAVRFRQSVGDHQITVFTEPTPLRVGRVDVSVLVQDHDGSVIRDAVVEIRLNQSQKSFHGLATHESATNKLLQAVEFDLPASGRWDVEVDVAVENAREKVGFSIVVAGPLPRWVKLWPWFAWPSAVIFLFVLHQALVWGETRRR